MPLQKDLLSGAEAYSQLVIYIFDYFQTIFEKKQGNQVIKEMSPNLLMKNINKRQKKKIPHLTVWNKKKKLEI